MKVEVEFVNLQIQLEQQLLLQRGKAVPRVTVYVELWAGSGM